MVKIKKFRYNIFYFYQFVFNLLPSLHSLNFPTTIFLIYWRWCLTSHLSHYWFVLSNRCRSAISISLPSPLSVRFQGARCSFCWLIPFGTWWHQHQYFYFFQQTASHPCIDRQSLLACFYSFGWQSAPYFYSEASTCSCFEPDWWLTSNHLEH